MNKNIFPIVSNFLVSLNILEGDYTEKGFQNKKQIFAISFHFIKIKILYSLTW